MIANRNGQFPPRPAKGSRGFTLVEAAVALGVVAILSGVLVPLVLRTLQSAREARARREIQVICGAIAAQMKDTGGRRPRTILWYYNELDMRTESNAIFTTSDDIPEESPYINHLTNNFVSGFPKLFNSTRERGNALFGFRGDNPPSAEFGYKGPYLNPAAAIRNDPWGRSYLILGYNSDGEQSGGPIWVVSAGPKKTIEGTNLAPHNNFHYPLTWDYSGASEGNIAVRVQ